LTFDETLDLYESIKKIVSPDLEQQAQEIKSSILGKKKEGEKVLEFEKNLYEKYVENELERLNNFTRLDNFVRSAYRMEQEGENSITVDNKDNC